MKDWNLNGEKPEVICWVDISEESIRLRIFAQPHCEAGKKKQLVGASKTEPFKKGKTTKKENADTPTLESKWKADLPDDKSVEERQKVALDELKKALNDERLKNVFAKILEVVNPTLPAVAEVAK